MVDLGLKVVDYLWRDVVSQDLEEIDPLVAGDTLIGGQFDPLLDLLDGGTLGDEVGVLGLSDGLVGEESAFLGPACSSLDGGLREGAAYRDHQSEAQ